MNNKEKFILYANLLQDWSKKMNLVSKNTLNDIKSRHFDDSEQLADVLPNNVKVIDFGSGAGFPGVVLAILGWNVVCIESIRKKVDFLNTVKKQLALDNLTVYHGRVESYVKTLPTKLKDSVVTCRAFAALDKILNYLKTKQCRLFLLKGCKIAEEIEVAKKNFVFTYSLVPSKTGDGFIVIIDKK